MKTCQSKPKRKEVSVLAGVQVEGWDNYFYDVAARNSIDVGEYLGRCLAALTTSQGVPATSLHLAGHRHTTTQASCNVWHKSNHVL